MENFKSEIDGWGFMGSTPKKYDFFWDSTIYHTGKKSATIVAKCDMYEEDDFVTIIKEVNAKKYRGSRVQFSAFVKSRDVENWAGLWMRIDNDLFQSIQYDIMQNKTITGTTQWNIYHCVLDVPQESETISMGLLLSKKGQVWIDNVDFEMVDNTVSTTELKINDNIKEKLESLNFESKELM